MPDEDPRMGLKCVVHGVYKKRRHFITLSGCMVQTILVLDVTLMNKLTMPLCQGVVNLKLVNLKVFAIIINKKKINLLICFWTGYLKVTHRENIQTPCRCCISSDLIPESQCVKTTVDNHSAPMQSPSNQPLISSGM